MNAITSNKPDAGGSALTRLWRKVPGVTPAQGAEETGTRPSEKTKTVKPVTLKPKDTLMFSKPKVSRMSAFSARLSEHWAAFEKWFVTGTSHNPPPYPLAYSEKHNPAKQAAFEKISSDYGIFFRGGAWRRYLRKTQEQELAARQKKEQS